MTRSVHNLRAIGCALLGFTLWVFADTLMKLAGEAEIPFYQVIGFLGLFMMLNMVVGMGVRGKLKTLMPQNPKTQFIRGLLSLGSNLTNAIALKHLPLTLFYVTVFTAPMMIAILAAFFLRERLTVPKTIAIIVGFIGVVIAINPFGHLNEGDWIGYAAATASTVCFAVSSIWLRRMTQSESIASVAFTSAFVEAAGGFGLMLVGHYQPMNGYLFFILFTMSIFCVIGNMLNYYALRLTAAATVMQFHYSQIIAGALIGYLIWHDVPSLMTITGAAVIIGSGLFVVAHSHRAGMAIRAEQK